MTRILTIIALLFATPACAPSNLPNSIGMRGNSLQTGLSIEEMRNARKGIRILNESQELPEFSRVLTRLEVSRCHQNWNQEKPSQATLVDDLVLAAYAQGADAISDIEFTSSTGLLKNCWLILSASATAIAFPNR